MATSYKNILETNKAILKALGIEDEMIIEATIRLSTEHPPLIELTKLMKEDGKYTKIDEEFELKKKE